MNTETLTSTNLHGADCAHADNRFVSTINGMKIFVCNSCNETLYLA